LCGEEAGSEQIVSEPVRCAPDKICGRWRNNDNLCIPGEPDVIERVTGAENLGMHWPSGNRFERDRPDELAGAARHHYVDFSSRLSKQTRQPH
jgi:hypothetical protein